jgi:hypothetical protein
VLLTSAALLLCSLKVLLELLPGCALRPEAPEATREEAEGAAVVTGLVFEEGVGTREEVVVAVGPGCVGGGGEKKEFRAAVAAEGEGDMRAATRGEPPKGGPRYI